MTRTYTLALAAILVAASSAGLAGQSKGLDPARILEPLKDNWLTYSGDYSGKRYSALTQINQSNVKHLTLAWVSRVTAGAGGPGSGGRGGFGGFGGGPPTIIRGERDAPGAARAVGGGANNPAALLPGGGLLFFSPPHHAGGARPP